MKRLMYAAVAALLLAFGAGAADAATCTANSSVFGDVADSDFFCTDTQWLRNRGVTFGCNPGGTLYCANDPVLRSQMAAFLQRLGRALRPELLTNTGAVILPGNLSGSTVLGGCGVGAFQQANWPRIARVRGTLHINAVGPALSMFFRYSTNFGNTYALMPGTPLVASNLNGERTLSWMADLLVVPAGTPVPLFFQIAYTNPGGGTTVINGGQCAIDVEILNDNPDGPPY